jgi:PST family polysaccharide transporter
MISRLGDRRGGLKGQVVYLFGSNVVDRLLGLLGSVVIARYLGAAELGRVGPALVLGALVARFSDFGVSVALQRDVAREPERAAHLLARAFGFRTVSSGVGLAAVVAYALGTEGAGSRAWLPVLAGIGALCTAWFQVFASVWIGCLRSEYVAVAQTVYRVLYLGLIGAAILLGGGSNAIMLALMLASLAQLLVGVSITRRAFFAPSVMVRLSSCVALLRDTWPIGISAFTVMAYDRVDTLVASWFLPPIAVGNYVAAYAFYSATLTLSNPITSVAFSVFSRHAPDRRTLLAQFRKGTASIFTLGASVALALGVLASTITGIVYGSKYENADSCLRVLAVAVPFLFANNLAGVTLNAIGKQRATMALTVGGLAFNLALNLFTVPVFGIKAAAWATVATELAVAVGAGVAVEYMLRRGGEIGKGCVTAREQASVAG